MIPSVAVAFEPPRDDDTTHSLPKLPSMRHQDVLREQQVYAIRHGQTDGVGDGMDMC